jgi:hypothetical protein
MALAIDTKDLLDTVKRHEARMMDAEIGIGGRLQLHRVCVYAVVREFEHTPGREDAVVRDSENSLYSEHDREARDWQADQDDDLDELEVLHHLKQLSAIKWMLSSSNGNNAATATLVANVQSPTFSARLQDRPASSFQRFSRRLCFVDFERLRGMSYVTGVESRLPRGICPKFRDGRGKPYLPSSVPNIVCANTRQEYIVYWHTQYDYVDLHTPRLMSTQRTEKDDGRSTPSTKCLRDAKKAHHGRIILPKPRGSRASASAPTATDG